MTSEGSAHGRVNLVGEHTDYNRGLVLPTLLPQRTIVTVVPRRDLDVSLRSDAPGAEAVRASLDALAPRRDWSDYVLGVAHVLRLRGHAVGGFDGNVRSDVPVGAGLASSAALAVATARALRDAFAIAIDDREVASVAHEAEDRFAGAHVGLMDQLACSLGSEGVALFMDMRDLSTRALGLAGLDMDIAVIDSGIRHAHSSGAYNARRRECEDAARALGVASLREVRSAEAGAALPGSLGRRVRHVVSENARVEEAVAAITRGDAAALGDIVNRAHASLRDDYEVSLPDIDALVRAAQRDPEVLGARLTGGGFGGSVLLLTRRGSARRSAERVAHKTGGPLTIVVPRASTAHEGTRTLGV